MENFGYEILAEDGRAKRARLMTPHGAIETPVFMNVGTAAAIKGGLCAADLRQIGCEVFLANTYHLHLRPGDELIRQMGGVRRFMAWERPVLTDSGGFQVFSLAGLRKISEAGVEFASYIDGRRIFMGPEESMQIQLNLGATIAMAFDECPPANSEREYINDSADRTTRWLLRCIDTHKSRRGDSINPHQMLFGINQGGIFADIRAKHAKTLSQLDLPGYAIGGLAVGETHEQMYAMIEAAAPHLPRNRPTYLMGVGTPANILEAVERGIDFFDCVMPARNGRHGHLFTSTGKININNACHEKDDSPIDPACACPTCASYSRAYLRHLFKAREILALRLAVLHNLHFYNTLMVDIRAAIEQNRFAQFKRDYVNNLRI